MDDVRMTERRTLLKGVAGLGTIVGAGGSALTACSPATPGPTSTPTTGGGQAGLPTYRAVEVMTPDLPGDEDLMAGLLAYPADPPTSVTGDVLTSGETLTVFGTQSSPMTPLAQNDMWQTIMEQMGGDLEWIIAPNDSEHLQKLQTLMAGDDLPDIAQLASIPKLPEALDRQFADLTDHLSGDNILEYPNLAAIPTWAWQSSIYNGRLFTIPTTRGKLAAIPLARRDMTDQRGLSLEVSSGEEFRELCRSLTDERNNQWAIGQNPGAWVGPVLQMLGGPNGWREDNGSFTHMFETEEYERAIEIVTEMVQVDKVFHPDAFGGGDVMAWFTGGTVALQYGSYQQWAALINRGGDVPGFDVGSYAPPRWDGGGTAAPFVNTAPVYFSGIRKNSPDRVKECLRALNYWAAPLGSAEYLLLYYGVSGVHHDLQGTDPIRTQTGQAEVFSPITSIVSGAPVLFHPGRPELTEEAHALQGTLVPDGVADPSIGLYSELNLSSGASLSQRILEFRGDILAGRADLSEWPTAVEEWRQGGGDAVRAEFEASFAERHGG